VLRRQWPTCPPQRLEPEVGLLEVDLGAVHGDELLGAALLVLQAAEADGAGAQPVPAPDALHGLEGGQLLLVHQVDPVPAVRDRVEAVGLPDAEVLGSLLDAHGGKACNIGRRSDAQRLPTLSNPARPAQPAAVPGVRRIALLEPGAVGPDQSSRAV